ncbi:HNH endonuclease [Tardibacter chloracetimidivorans]|nr:HNH endonuclease [Tardibacter chloracetimidivorans]
MPPVFRAGGGARQGERERKREHDRWRGSAFKRGYDRDWMAVRDQVIEERGYRCEDCGCLGVKRKADAGSILPLLEADHLLSIEERPDLRLDKGNLRVRCKPCHSRRTAREQGFARGRR